MKYRVCYQEMITHYEEVETGNHLDAWHEVMDRLKKGTIQNKDAYPCGHRLIDIKAENGDAYTTDDYKIKQYQWQGHGPSEARELGLRD